MLAMRPFFGGCRRETHRLCCVAACGRGLGDKSEKRIVGGCVIEERVRLGEQVTVQEPPPSRANYFTGPDIAAVLMSLVKMQPLELLLNPLPISVVSGSYAGGLRMLAHVALKQTVT